MTDGDLIPDGLEHEHGLDPNNAADAQLDSADRCQATDQHPWRFWINDPDDWGDTGGTDIPGSMFRHKFLGEAPSGGTQGGIPPDPPNWPDAARNGRHFFMVHGYNVSYTAARGTYSEVFKRLFWCGSNAMFTGISWHCNETQIVEGATPDGWLGIQPWLVYLR